MKCVGDPHLNSKSAQNLFPTKNNLNQFYSCSICSSTHFSPIKTKQKATKIQTLDSMRDVFFILCCIQSPYRSNFKKQHHMPHSDSFFCIVCYSCMPHSNMYEIYCTIATLSSFIVCVFFFLFRHL